MLWSRSLLLTLLGAALAVVAPLISTASSDGRGALLVTVDSAIGPASADYILEGIRTAERDGHDLLIIEMDTPGGLDSAMRDIIKGILGLVRK